MVIFADDCAMLALPLQGGVVILHDATQGVAFGSALGCYAPAFQSGFVPVILFFTVLGECTNRPAQTLYAPQALHKN